MIMGLFLAFSSLIMGVAIGGIKALEGGRLTVQGLQQLWGLTANFNLICYYAAPLSTVYAVISTRYVCVVALRRGAACAAVATTTHN